MLPAIDSVGIDIWTMDKGIMFDNIVIDSSPEKAFGSSPSQVGNSENTSQLVRSWHLARRHSRCGVRSRQSRPCGPPACRLFLRPTCATVVLEDNLASGKSVFQKGIDLVARARSKLFVVQV